MIGYSIVSRRNGIFFKNLTSRILAFLLNKIEFLKFKIFIVIIQDLPASGFKNLLKVSIICGCIVFSGNGMVFNFLILQFYRFVFIKLAIFSSFFDNFCHFIGLPSLKSQGTSSRV